jgi:hypothetical protein
MDSRSAFLTARGGHHGLLRHLLGRGQFHQRDDTADLTAEVDRPVESCVTVAERYRDRKLALYFRLRIRIRDRHVTHAM